MYLLVSTLSCCKLLFSDFLLFLIFPVLKDLKLNFIVFHCFFRYHFNFALQNSKYILIPFLNFNLMRVTKCTETLEKMLA